MDRVAAQAQLRRRLESRGIRDVRVLDAIEGTPRDLFIPARELDDAYADIALSIDCGQTISQPYVVALMTEALALTGQERVLEIGTGSGYQAAILSRLCREVVTVERLAPLASSARRVLGELGCRNIRFCEGDGTLGWPPLAPYAGIIVTAAAPRIPLPLLEQLDAAGRLVVPVGDESLQELWRVTLEEGKPVVDVLCGCRFVKLIGAAGWPEETSGPTS